MLDLLRKKRCKMKLTFVGDLRYRELIFSFYENKFLLQNMDTKVPNFCH